MAKAKGKRAKSKRPGRPAPRKASPRAAARRQAARAHERAAEAESLRLSERAGRLVAARDKLLASEAARDKEARARAVRQRASAPELSQLLEAFDRMSERPGISSLRVENAPVGEGILPWLVVGEFSLEGGIDYAGLHSIIRHWERDLILESMIHPKRLSWVRFIYQQHDNDGNPIGKPEGYAASGADDWERVISDTEGDTDPDDDDSLAAKYVNTTIGMVQVYFGKR